MIWELSPNEALAKMKGPTLFLCAALLFMYNPTTATNQCPTGCNGVTPNLFKYADGTTYKYNLEGNIDISLSSAEGQTSTKLSATVLLTQQPNCNQVLRLQNLVVNGPDAKKYTGLENIDKSIALNFHDGHIEDHICAEAGDTQHSLNIKRAVASMFQAAVKHHHESDVFGDCPTELSTRKEGPMTVIHKTRNLERCAHRESIKQDFMATSFNDNTDIHSSPLLHAEYESEQKLKNGILDSALVTEKYLYRPFSTGKNGAKATVTTKLTFAGTSKDAPKGKPTLPKSIHFENPHMETSKQANVDSILNSLKETKKTMDVSVSENSATTFVQLIKVLRASKKDNILSVYGQIKSGAGGITDKVSARKVYFDALFRAGTGDAVEAMMTLLQNNELSPIEQKLVFLSLSFTRHATPASLKAAAVIVDMPNLPREAYLGLGTLAGHYCNEHDCEHVEELNKLMEKMSSKLNSKPKTHKEENVVIAMLKGLANIHHLSDNILDKLVAVASDKAAPARLRVAALETFLADPCKSKLRDGAMKILKDTQEDSEIRIKAYLAVAQCPDSKSAKQLQDLLDHEPVYQVLVFISSHLNNLRASANPDKEHARQHLALVKTSQKYPVDPRKYSFNLEFSYSVDSLGLGSAVESNVIYSQNSFLPRSTSLNLTGEYFGHNFNFFEIGTRQENLDKVLEHYLGPLGVFRSHTPEEMYSTGKESVGKLAEHIRKRFEKTRGKRDVSKGEIEAFNKKVKIGGHDLNKDLDLDLSVKILGSEMLFLSFNEDIEKLTPDAIVDKIFDCMDEGIDKAKKFEYHMKNHMLFLDVETAYPTSMGFPLKLKVEGAAAIHFITEGSVDIKAILKDPKNAHMKMSLIPSANIELTGRLLMDSHFIETGLKVTSSILTSTGADVNVKLLENGKGIDVKMGLPVEKQTLMSFKHDIVFATQEIGKPEASVNLRFKDKTRDAMICFDQLAPIIGLNFCGEMNSPSKFSTNMVPFPLNSPADFKVEIERVDVKEYHFKAVLKDQKPNHKSVEILFDTPGSEHKRTVELILEAMTEPTKALRATLKSPFKTAIAEAVITDNNKEKTAMLRFQHDQTEYYGKIGASVEGDASKQIFKPLIEYHTPNDIVKTKGNRKPDYHVEGQVVVEKSAAKHKFTFDKVKLVSPGNPPIAIDGYLLREGKKYSTDVKVSRNELFVEAKGSVEASTEKINMELQMKNSIDDNLNFDVKYDMARGPNMLENKLAVSHGKDLGSKKHTLTLMQMVKGKYEGVHDFDFETKNHVKYPLVGLEVKVDGKASNKHVKYDVNFAYDKFKLESELDAKVNQKVPGDYAVEFELEALTNKVKLEAKRDVWTHGEKSFFKNVLEVNGATYSVEATVNHKIKPQDVNVDADVTVKVAGKADPFKINSKLVANSKDLDSLLKIHDGKILMVDMMAKGTRAPNPSGQMKIVVRDILNANGNFKVNDGVGTGMMLVDVPHMGRKVKAESKFTCKEPTHNLDLDVFFDFEKDNSKKLSVSTHNEVTKQSVDSKNKVDFLGQTMGFNMKGNMEGSFIDGKQHGEFDLTLPNKMVMNGKLDRNVKSKDNVMNGDMHVLLEMKDKKDSPKGYKLDVKGKAVDSNPKEHVFDFTWNILAQNPTDKDLKMDITMKHKHEGDKKKSLYATRLHGSVMPNPVEVDVSGEYMKREGSYKIMASYGKDLSTKMVGKYNMVGGSTPVSGEIEMEIMTPADKYKSMKGHASGTMLLPHGDNHHFEMSGKASASINDKTVNVDGSVKMDKNKGDLKAKLQLPNEDPVSVAANYGHEPTAPGFGKCHCGVDIHYGKGKNVKAEMKVNRPNKGEADMEFDLKTPSDYAKHLNLVVKGKRSEDGKHMTSEVHLAADDKKYSLNNDLVISEVSPSIDIKLTHPDKKVSRIYAKSTRLAPRKYTGEVKLQNLKDFSLDMSGESDFESVDNFMITMNLHSEKLKLDKVKVDIVNKGGKSGKKIEFSAKSGDKNLVSGSTNYKAHEEGGKYIVEGTGTFKVKEESKSANFKFIKQNLDKDEHGTEITFNAGLGSRGIVGELKLTNKQFRILNSYCEEKSQCAHFEVFAQHTTDVNNFNHELQVNIDLRKLGLSHEFGLKAVTNRKDFVLDHTVDVHFESSGNSKYQYSLYVHPKEAGIVLTMPKRVIALEGKVDRSDKKKGPIKGEVAFYMNKMTEPTKKTVLDFMMDVDMNEKNGKVVYEAKFNNPNLAKELTVKYEAKYDYPGKKMEYKVEFDVFGKKSHKVVVSGHLTGNKLEKGYKVDADMIVVSKGFDLEMKAVESISVSMTELLYDYSVHYHLDKTKSECALKAKMSMNEVEFLLKVLNKELLHVDSKLQLSKHAQVADTTMSAYGIAPVVSHFELKDLNTMKFTLAKKATPNNKLQVSSGFAFGQIADFRAEVIKGSAKNDLVHASVKLDDANFMKPDFGINVENIKKMVLDPMTADTQQAMKELKNLVVDFQKAVSEHIKHISDLLSKNIPNLKPMVAYYQTELGKLKDELISDKTVQEVSEFLKKVFGTAIHTLADLFHKAAEICEKLAHILNEHLTKAMEIVSKDILPMVREIGTKFLDMYVGLMKNVYDVVAIYVMKMADLLTAHKAELKQMATAASEAFRNFGQIIFKTMQNLRAELERVLNDLFEQIKAFPIFEELKERYEMLLSGMPVPDHVISVFKEISNTIKEFMPTPEAKDFVQTFTDYVMKKLKQEKVADSEYMKKLYTSLMRAISSIVALVKEETSGSPGDMKHMFEALMPLPVDTLLRIPKAMVMHFSPLRRLMNGEFPHPSQYMHQMSFNPLHMLPPYKKHAIIVQGQHIFTFDDRHLTFPGTCSYVLAEDAVNGNFTLVGSYKDAQLDGLTFSDKKDIVTIKKDHKFLVNGKESEMPYRSKELHVFRLYETVHIVSKAGVRVVCEPHLFGCGIYVSGFYHGQMRGLLGNGNNEPYDDFTLPDGKIVTEEDKFGNAYGVGGGCTPVKTPSHHEHHHNQACEDLFGRSSPMRMCHPFVDVKPFIQACEHGMAAGIKDTDKSIATAYVSACRHRNIPVNTPAKMVQCHNSEKPIDVGSGFSVKVPGKAADIVIIMEQNKGNEPVFKDLIQPLITALTNDLKAKGITDIDFSLIGFGGEYSKYPSHYTNGGKIRFHGKASNLKFVDPEKHEMFKVGHPKVDEILEKVFHVKVAVKEHLGLTPTGDAIREGLKYPFRAGAVKHVLFVPGTSHVSSVRLLTSLKNMLMYNPKKTGLHYTVITPADIQMKDAKHIKNIIGFDDKEVFTYADAKKKQGNADLRKDIHFVDVAADFAINHHGNVFLSNNFKEGKAGQKKTFIQMVSHAMTASMTGEEQHLDCMCQMVNPYDARNVCHVTSTKSK